MHIKKETRRMDLIVINTVIIKILLKIMVKKKVKTRKEINIAVVQGSHALYVIVSS